MTEKEETAESTQPQVNCFCMGAGPQITVALGFRSEKAREHLRNARVEFLKAIRTLIDERISYLSRHQAKGTKIGID